MIMGGSSLPALEHWLKQSSKAGVLSQGRRAWSVGFENSESVGRDRPVCAMQGLRCPGRPWSEGSRRVKCVDMPPLHHVDKSAQKMQSKMCSSSKRCGALWPVSR